MSPCSPGAGVGGGKAMENKMDPERETAGTRSPVFLSPWAVGPLKWPVGSGDCFSPKVTKKKQLTNIKQSFLHFVLLLGSRSLINRTKLGKGELVGSRVTEARPLPPLWSIEWQEHRLHPTLGFLRALRWVLLGDIAVKENCVKDRRELF